MDNIETITVNAFLYNPNSNKSSTVCMDCELCGWRVSEAANLHASLKDGKTNICRKIIKVLEELQLDIPKSIAKVIFHNGSKDNVEGYDGKNDEILQGKLPQKSYVNIVSSIESSLISYRPEIKYILS